MKSCGECHFHLISFGSIMLQQHFHKTKPSASNIQNYLRNVSQNYYGAVLYYYC